MTLYLVDSWKEMTDELMPYYYLYDINDAIVCIIWSNHIYTAIPRRILWCYYYRQKHMMTHYAYNSPIDAISACKEYVCSNGYEFVSEERAEKLRLLL